MRALFLVFAAVGLVALQSCTTIQCGTNKSQFLEQYERFMTEAEQMDNSVTDKAWLIFDEQLEVYLVDCYPSLKDEMSQSDRNSVMLDALHYYYIRYGSHMAKEIRNPSNPTSEVIVEELGQLWSDSEQSMRTILDEEWAEITNVFLEDLDALKETLIESLEED